MKRSVAIFEKLGLEVIPFQQIIVRLKLESTGKPLNPLLEQLILQL